MKTNKREWQPQPGSHACYKGNAAKLLRMGTMVKVVAEASAGRMVVEAIGHRGVIVSFTVATKNLTRPQPGLFD